MSHHNGPFSPPHDEPLRRVVTAVYRYDDVAGRFVLVPVAEELTSMVGSEVRTVRTAEAYVCGCSREHPPGGTCYHCALLSCVRCFAHCAMCLKPLCPSHTRLVLNEQGHLLKLCGRCSARHARASLGRALWRGVRYLVMGPRAGGGR